MTTKRFVVDVVRTAPPGGHGRSSWCSIHDMAPGDCFELHYPMSTQKVRDQVRSEKEA